MDRLDTWLNAQRGWRLLLVRCLPCPAIGLFAGSTWSGWVTFDPATPQVRALVTRMALCVAASFLLAPLTLLPRSWRDPARRPDRTGFTWRQIAVLYSWCGIFVVMAYAQAEPLAWQQHNGWTFLLQVAFFGVAAVMFAWNALYQRRLRRLRDHEVSPADSSW